MKNTAYVVEVNGKKKLVRTWHDAKSLTSGVPEAKVIGGYTTMAMAMNTIAEHTSSPSKGLACDGGSKGNPGKIVAKVFNLASGKLLWEGPKKAMTGTNNQAEILALGKACFLAEYKERIYTDSRVVLAWIAGKGNPTVPSSWMTRIQEHISDKELVIKKWEKGLWGETPADCK